ncbi:MAG: HlyC/CorC family transporter [Clostridia bacterium]|nr:HlyC/CorC family transporter [Clostridia bacterium]
MSDTLRYILIVVCILLSATFSGSEIAFMQLNETKLRHEAEEKNSRLAKLALRFRERFDSGLIAILIGNNLVNIGSSSIAAALAISLMGEKGAWVATAIMTVLIITFGEILPKIFASERAEGVAKVMSLPLTAIWLVLFPLIWLLERFLKLLSGIWKEKESDDTVTEDDMETILDTVEDEGVVDEDTADLLQSAFDFDEVLAYEIITPRVDLVAIDIEDPREKQMKIAFASPFTRIPVYRDTPDHIVGILHLNHLYKAMVENPDVPIQSLLMPVVYVHKTTPLPDVLDTMRRKKSHMVVVTDEYGGTMGILTMEDVLEQLVGEIWDETDKIEEEFVEIGENRYEVDGDMRLNDFLDEFDKEEEDLDDDNATVGGWAVEMLGGYPKLYDSFTFEDLTVTVLKKERMRILRLLVEQNPDWIDEEDEDDEDEE